MKKILTILICIICLSGGYVLGSYYPLSGLFPKDNAPTTTSEVLTVTVVDEEQNPMVGIEIDIAEQAGPPPSWGVKEADTSGKAIYNLEPGTYYVFFNTNRFPMEYVVPKEQEITIVKGESKDITIVLEKE